MALKMLKTFKKMAIEKYYESVRNFQVKDVTMYQIPHGPWPNEMGFTKNGEFLPIEFRFDSGYCFALKTEDCINWKV